VTADAWIARAARADPRDLRSIVRQVQAIVIEESPSTWAPNLRPIFGVPFVLMPVACDAIQAWTLRVRVVCASDRVSRATLEIVEDLKNSGGPISCPPCCGIPEANGIAERFVRTVRSKCLDRLLIVNRRHLERTLTVFVDHDNGYRPHRSLDLAPPNGRRAIENWTGTRSMAVKRGDRLGGLLHEYEPAT
jgi:hypothetical protein